MPLIMKIGNKIHHTALEVNNHWAVFREPLHLQTQIQEGLMYFPTSKTCTSLLASFIDGPKPSLIAGSSYNCGLSVNKEGRVYVASLIFSERGAAYVQQFKDITDVDFYVIGNNVDLTAAINMAHSLGYDLDAIYTAMEQYIVWDRREMAITDISHIQSMLAEHEVVVPPRIKLVKGAAKWEKN